MCHFGQLICALANYVFTCTSGNTFAYPGFVNTSLTRVGRPNLSETGEHYIRAIVDCDYRTIPRVLTVQMLPVGRNLAYPTVARLRESGYEGSFQ